MGCENFQPVSEIVLDHAVHPRHHGKLNNFNGHARVTGPCGDTMEFWLMVNEDRIVNISFITDGCHSSLACGSIACCLALGKELQVASNLQQKEILDALIRLPDENEHCALLASNTLKAACEDYKKQKEQCSSCSSKCPPSERAESENTEEFEEKEKLKKRLAKIKHKIVVLSGKGGVGKSTVAVNLATTLVLAGKRVGLLDIDIHGPSIPTMLGLENEIAQSTEEGLLPIELGEFKIMSIGFLLKNADEAIIWRGPAKMGVIQEFLQEVVWGELDYLIIDSPPGTGDEPLSLCQLIEDLDGAVIVTTPQKVAQIDVRKSVTFCNKLNVPILGIIENMGAFICPKCGESLSIFPLGAGKQIANDMQVRYLGSIPIDPQIAESCDNGKTFIHHFATSPTAKIMREIIEPIIKLECASNSKELFNQLENEKERIMKIAIPLAEGKLTSHFGHCASFAILEIEASEKRIIKRTDIDAPPHEPGLLPRWLAEKGVNLVIAGGMGQRAKALFEEQSIEVIVGAPSEAPEELATRFMSDLLQTGQNACDH